MSGCAPYRTLRLAPLRLDLHEASRICVSLPAGGTVKFILQASDAVLLGAWHDPVNGRAYVSDSSFRFTVDTAFGPGPLSVMPPYPSR